MGWVGRVFGHGREKPGNIAGAAIVMSMAMIVLTMLMAQANPNLPKNELFTLFGGIVTLALGYLFGKSGGD